MRRAGDVRAKEVGEALTGGILAYRRDLDEE